MQQLMSYALASAARAGTGKSASSVVTQQNSCERVGSAFGSTLCTKVQRKIPKMKSLEESGI